MLSKAKGLNIRMWEEVCMIKRRIRWLLMKKEYNGTMYPTLWKMNIDDELLEADY